MLHPPIQNGLKRLLGHFTGMKRTRIPILDNLKGSCMRSIEVARAFRGPHQIPQLPIILLSRMTTFWNWCRPSLQIALSYRSRKRRRTSTESRMLARTQDALRRLQLKSKNFRLIQVHLPIVCGHDLFKGLGKRIPMAPHSRKSGLNIISPRETVKWTITCTRSYELGEIILLHLSSCGRESLVLSDRAPCRQWLDCSSLA